MSARDEEQAARKVLASSAVMAVGTVFSRLSGLLRSLLLLAALGNQLHADQFAIANTIPNMLYILLAGGVFNAVLVPQLVRAMRNDADGGEAYTNRVITLAGLFLAAVTVLLVALAPLVMAIYLGPAYGGPELADQRESVIAFARYCLPQVFFYGMFVLVGQILNARGRFGPMMWAPIANNVISVLVLVAYLVVYGEARGSELTAGYGTGQELLLGLGSTLGIAVQLLILLPYLRAAGFTFRPRFDFRNSGLGHTLRLGIWTVLFVIVNQVAYTVVVRLASGGGAASAGPGQGTGYAVYSTTFLIVMVPHSVITVSLATAVLPQLSARAADLDLRGVATTLNQTLRSALALILPFALLLPVVAPDIANAISFGAGRESYRLLITSLALFGPGVLFFTVHYLMLRGFYALERTRTVFWVQCVIAATNVGVALVLVHATDARFTSPALVLAYTASYAVGSVLSFLLLRHLLGGLRTRVLARFVVRLVLAAGTSTAVAALVAHLLRGLVERPNQLAALATGSAVLFVDVAVFLGLARLLRVHEVTSLVDTVRRRLPSARR